MGQISGQERHHSHFREVRLRTGVGASRSLRPEDRVESGWTAAPPLDGRRATGRSHGMCLTPARLWVYMLSKRGRPVTLYISVLRPPKPELSLGHFEETGQQ